MAVSSSRDPNWAASLFSDAEKMASIVEDLKELILKHVEGEQMVRRAFTAVSEAQEDVY